MLKYYKISDTKDEDYQKTGQGQKNLLIISPAENINSDTEKMLRDMVKAIKFDFDSDIFFIETYKKDIDINQILQPHPASGSATIISFGINAKDLNINIEATNYQPTKIGETLILFADDLPAIYKNKNLKMKLWKCLQSIFLNK